MTYVNDTKVSKEIHLDMYNGNLLELKNIIKDLIKQGHTHYSVMYTTGHYGDVDEIYFDVPNKK